MRLREYIDSVHRSDPRRGGYTIVELVVSAILLGTIVAITIPTLSIVAQQRREGQRRQEAIEEVANLMESLTARPCEELTDEQLKDVRFDDEFQGQFPDGKLKISVTELPEQHAKRIGVTFSWPDRRGQQVTPVRLTAWVYQDDVDQTDTESTERPENETAEEDS